MRKILYSCSLVLIRGSLLFSAAPPQEPARVGVGVIERKITLEDAIEFALKNNLDIEIERTNVANASQFLNAARGAFDGIFRWQPGYEKRNTPTSSVLFGAGGKLAEDFHNENFSYLQKLNWQGASFQAGFDNTRTSTTNPFVSLNPTTTSRLVLSFTQPLLRGRKIDRDRAEIKIRSKALSVSQVDLELRVIDVVARVEAAYWDLVAARQDVKVKADGVEWAGEQLGRSKRMIDSGTLAPIELSGAQAELDRRLDTYHASIAALTEAENNLKTLVAAGRRQDIWGDVLIPAEERTVEATQYDDLQQAVNLAIQKRPELRQITIRKESNEAQKVLAQDLVKPRINAVVGYVNSGLAGTVPLSSTPNAFTQSTIITTQRLNELSALAGLPAVVVPSVGSVPSSLIGGYGSTLSGLFGGNFPGIQAGLNIDFTTRNRAAEAGVQQNVIAERRLKLEQTRTEQAIAAQVRNSMQAIQSARQRILAAESSAKAAKEKLDSETRLFQSGESTSFLVLTRQNEYTDSLRRVVVSRLDFNKAEARLHQALGTTLETHKVKVQ